MSIFNEKLVILAGMFVATMVFGLLPIWVVRHFLNLSGSESDRSGSERHHREQKQRTRLKKAVSFASCFSGGVFIAACLLDLLPDVHEAFDHVLDEIENKYHTKIDYPVAEFIIVVGFFIVLILEQIVLDCKEQWQNEDLVARTDIEERQPLVSSTVSGYGSRDDNNQQNSSFSRSTSVADSHIDEHDTGSLNAISFRVPVNSNNDGHNHGSDIFVHSPFRSVLLIIALTFHSLFEGLAIGLQQELGQLMSIFIAVVVHKAVMAFSLGLNIVQSNFTPLVSIASIFVFSASSPIGMGIGMVIADLEKNLISDCANGILQGIAGGTFLYITFFEVLPHELNSPGNRMPKLLFVLSGFSCICGLLFLTH